MKRGFVCALLGMVLASVVGACQSSSACKAGQPFCYCPKGATCAQTCSGPQCSLYCANGDSTCTLRGGDGATATCQNARSCSATTGKSSTVACQYVRGSCAASVGDGSTVQCEGAAKCDVTCAGACKVNCPGGHCKVTCAGDPSACRLACSGMKTCPDGKTLTCDAPCE